ncbi:hypothetical protein JHK87_024518 [Glycine soja]|nr:hypothetical protein JHK87_024518 [Glycine soja]
MHDGHNPPPSTVGVLGLGNGKASILSQLHSLGLIRNVVGHYLSGRGGGFLFFGDRLIPQSGVTVIPLLYSPRVSTLEFHVFRSPYLDITIIPSMI